MTLIEAAVLLSTTPDNLRGAIKRGSLKASKHGRDWWVERKEVERYGRENRRVVHQLCCALPKDHSGDCWCESGTDDD